MTITDFYDLHKLVPELEVAFQIDGADFEEPDVDKLISNVKVRINRQYQIDVINYKIDSTELLMSKSRDSVALFTENIANIHAKFCGYAQIARYKTSTEISLSDINYLGFDETSLKTTLIAMERQYFLPRVGENIEAIKTKLTVIGNCWEKRLFILMIVAYELGFYELTACIAEILHQSMIK